MILIDTSAWIDYLRGYDTPARAHVRAMLAEPGSPISMCEPVAMEILAGPLAAAMAGQGLRTLEDLVNGLPTLALDETRDFRAAAAIFRDVRRTGRTVRSLVDCLIAAIAIRYDATLVHKDADFEAIAGVVALRTLSLR